MKSKPSARYACLPRMIAQHPARAVGFIPFFTPINFFQTWWVLLAVPLAIGISMVYKAMRYRHYRNYWRQVAIMTVQILGGMIAMMVGLFLFVNFIVPLL